MFRYGNTLAGRGNGYRRKHKNIRVLFKSKAGEKYRSNNILPVNFSKADYLPVVDGGSQFGSQVADEMSFLRSFRDSKNRLKKISQRYLAATIDGFDAHGHAWFAYKHRYRVGPGVVAMDLLENQMPGAL